MNYETIISKIIELCGGENNIVSHTSCMTRLRVSVASVESVDIEALKKVDGVLGINQNNKELQLIFGPGKVEKARAQMDNVLGEGRTLSFEEEIEAQKGSVKDKRTTKFQQFMSKFSNIFVPLIPGFIAAGTLAGIAGFMKAMGLDGETVQFISVFNKSLMTYLYVIIGFQATKAFGGSGILGAILGGLFIMSYGPEGTSGMESFYGLTIDPRGGMLGVLIVAIITAYVEKFIRKHFSWDATDIITTPILTLLVMSAATFAVFMPVSHILFQGMSWLFVNLSSNPIGNSVLAGLFLPSVMLGIHQGFVPVYEGLVETLGYNTLFPVLAMAGAGQVGASLALYVKAPKDSNLRKNIRGAIIPGFLGIGEPLIYGVTLPRVRPFFTAMAGGAVGGLYVGILNMFDIQIGLNTVFGSSGLLGTIAMTSNKGVITGMVFYLSALVVAYIAGFLITSAFGTKNVDLS
ncbi:PTS N-acetylmuramic acid transporter subunit IIBC [Mollicutes bacterium LVI A0039]|nr:PTS N-acetylmuramic acid transporter subunit IIBC [Mollicutes bacterium LVI A0039]